MLNNERGAEQMLVGMFRRKSTADVEGEICPYCEFVNKPGSATCAQCYYELNKAPRDQRSHYLQRLAIRFLMN